MTLRFQKSIAKSQAVLPVAGVLALVLWYVLPVEHASSSFCHADDGLWQYVPSFLQEGYWSLSLSAFCVMVAVYLMAELNNANVLLRVNSRMLSSLLALLLALVVDCHHFQPGSVLMLFSLLSFFPLFATYQLPSPLFSFLTYLMVSVASLVFPKLLWMVPLYWLVQGHLRAFSLRCFIASLLGLVLPYWLYGGIAIMTDSLEGFVSHVSLMADFQWSDYTQLALRDVLVFAYIILLFVSGVVDFWSNRFRDKTRTRIIYNVVILHGFGAIALMVLQPQYFYTLLPLLLIDTSIVFGHFFTLTFSKFTHVYCLILMMLAIAVVAAQYMPDIFAG